MAASQQLSFRLPPELVEALDAYAARLRRETRGLVLTRADVVRILLTRALVDEGLLEPTPDR